MSERIIDVSHLSPYNFGSQGPLFWGMLGIILIESVVFSCLIATYFYMRMRAPSWPPPGIENPDLLLPTIATVILLVSSAPIHWGDTGIERGDNRALRFGMLAGIVLALAFLSVKAYEYSHLPYRWDSHAYGSIVWAISGFHALHVTALVLKTIVVDLLAWRGYFNPRRRLGVTINGIYWHFVVAVWIPLYFLLYWSPRL
jgi:heme/copper-type cytochrome/quinol oxidase subunit 3